MSLDEQAKEQGAEPTPAKTTSKIKADKPRASQQSTTLQDSLMSNPLISTVVVVIICVSAVSTFLVTLFNTKFDAQAEVIKSLNLKHEANVRLLESALEDSKSLMVISTSEHEAKIERYTTNLSLEQFQKAQIDAQLKSANKQIEALINDSKTNETTSQSSITYLSAANESLNSKVAELKGEIQALTNNKVDLSKAVTEWEKKLAEKVDLENIFLTRGKNRTIDKFGLDIKLVNVDDIDLEVDFEYRIATSGTRKVNNLSRGQAIATYVGSDIYIFYITTSKNSPESAEIRITKIKGE